ncbi:AI-2E family transporter [archaeon]|nr:AI-2E family transporter [archaeon]MBT4242135.1 AI-2E family transporter [archaeon]MBT4417823.1 AI-2E family transporter [archaeon]
MLGKDNFKGGIVLTLLIVLFGLAVLVIKPIVFSVLYGILLGYIFYPVYKLFLKKIKNETTSAILVCLALFFVIVAVTILILNILLRQIIDLYLLLQQIDIVNIAKDSLPEFLASSELSATILSSLNTGFSNFMANTITGFGDFLLNLPIIALHLFVVLFVFFFTLRDGEKALEYLRDLLPIKKETQARFFKQFKDITNSVLIGQIVIGIIQGLIAGIGFYIFGVENIIILTIISMVASVIPIVGPWLVWIPVDIYLFSIGQKNDAIGLLIYGAIIVNWIDNLIRPWLVSRKAKINSAIVIVGMIGGLLSFGMIGIIIGPLVLAYVILVFEIYKKKTLDETIIFKEEK